MQIGIDGCWHAHHNDKLIRTVVRTMMIDDEVIEHVCHIHYVFLQIPMFKNGRLSPIELGLPPEDQDIPEGAY